MRHVIYALGAVLIACGLVGLAWSIDLAGLERGTTFASAGASLLGAGVVTIALGRVAQLLERITDGAPQARVAHAPAPAATPGDDAAQAPTPTRSPEPPRGADGVALAAAQAEAALAESEAALAESKSAARDEPPPAQAAAVAPRLETPVKAPSAAAPPARPLAPAPAPRTEMGPGGLDPFPAPAAPIAPAPTTSVPPVAPAPPAAAEPRIVGRYQANGVDYALFSDGSIEAERQGLKQRFNSLVELKAFIEQS